MTKKDYIVAARMLYDLNNSNNSNNSIIAIEVENFFVKFFSNDNYRFNESRFREACKIK